MLVAYTIIPRFYQFLLFVLSAFNSKAKAARHGRNGWKERLAGYDLAAKPVIWMHCASVGEFEDIRVLIDQIHQHGTYSVYLTFQSPTGVGKVKTYPGVAAIDYMPIDTRANAIYFIDKVNPRAVVFSRAEFWLNHLVELKRRMIPVFISGFRVTSSNLYFSAGLKSFYGTCFSCFTTMFCEDRNTIDLMSKHFPKTKTVLAGNPRVDRVHQIGNTPRPDLDSVFKHLVKPVIVLGSLEPSDFDMHLKLIASIDQSVHWVVTPHEVDEHTLSALERSFKRSYMRLSRISADTEMPTIVLVDSVGNLAQLYRFAQLALVGGGFTRKGVHNVLEPVVHGVPVACGPNHRNYSDVLQLLSADLLTIYHNEQELVRWVNDHLSQDGEQLKRKLKTYISERLGASNHVFEAILTALQ